MELSPTNKIRIYGILGNPNALGLYVTVVFFLTYFYREFIRVPKRVLWTGLGLFLTVFILTYSRGATIGIVVFIIFFILYKRSITFTKHIVILLAASLAFTLWSYKQQTGLTYPIKAEQCSEWQKKAEKHKEGVSRFTKAFGEENISLSSEDGRLFYINEGIYDF